MNQEYGLVLDYFSRDQLPPIVRLDELTRAFFSLLQRFAQHPHIQN